MKSENIDKLVEQINHTYKEVQTICTTMDLNNDIVTRLRVLNHHAKKLAENESLHALHRDAFTRCEELTWKSAEEIMQLRQQVADLRGQRDEARREVCGMNESGLRMNDSDKQREAKRRGWDCFKETQ